jgi:uncharacterized membrane protein
MTAFALLFTLAAIGVSETVYLIRSRQHNEAPVCPIGDDCSVVLESKYNHIFFIRNDVLGLMAYIAIAFIAALLVIGIQPMWFWDLALKIMVGFGSLLSLFFTYLQARIIKAWCFWCVMSAFTMWFMAAIIIVSQIIN